jgi:hypothetical protein
MITPKSRDRVVSTMFGVKVEMFVGNGGGLGIFESGPCPAPGAMLRFALASVKGTKLKDNDGDGKTFFA